MQNDKKEKIIARLKGLHDHLKEKNIAGDLNDACVELQGIITAFDDTDSNPAGTPPPPPGGGNG
jgi:hypothetical protein